MSTTQVLAGGYLKMRADFTTGVVEMLTNNISGDWFHLAKTTYEPLISGEWYFSIDMAQINLELISPENCPPL